MSIEIENTNKIKFDTVRKKWDKIEGKWYFSVIDIVGIVTESSNPRNYWKVLKNRLKNTQNQLVTKCNQLKLEASDGKFYLTDVGNIDTITGIIKFLSPQNALTFKAWALNLSRPKEITITVFPKRKIGNEISSKDKEESYPQVTYKLSNLINKNSDDTTLLQ